MTETNLPSEASIELPKVHVSAEYILDGGSKTRENQFSGTGKVLKIIFRHFISVDKIFLFIRWGCTTPRKLFKCCG